MGEAPASTRISTMPQVTQIDCLAQLERYQLLWKSLLGQTRNATFAQSLEWLQACRRHRDTDQQLRVLLVHTAAEPLGILPLYLTTETTRIGTRRVLGYPLADWGIGCGPIGPNPTATLNVAMRHLSWQQDWDALQLSGVAEERDRGRTKLAMQVAGFEPREDAGKTTAAIELSPDGQAFLQSRAESLRARLGRAERQAAGLGAIAYLRYRPQGAMFDDHDPRLDLLDECLELDARTVTPETRVVSGRVPSALLRDLHLAATRAGAADLNLLRLNGRLIAFAYNVHLHGSLECLRLATDADHSGLAAADLLLARMVQDSCQRGDQLLNLAGESQSVDGHWPTRELVSRRLSYDRRGWASGQLLRLERWVSRLRGPRGRKTRASARRRLAP